MSAILVLDLMFLKLINMSLKKLFSLWNSGDGGWSLTAWTSVFFETPGATSIKRSSISGTCIPLEFVTTSTWGDVSDPCSQLHVLEANKHVFEKALQFAKFRRWRMEFQGAKISFFWDTGHYIDKAIFLVPGSVTPSTTKKRRTWHQLPHPH